MMFLTGTIYKKIVTHNSFYSLMTYDTFFSSLVVHKKKKVCAKVFQKIIYYLASSFLVLTISLISTTNIGLM